MSSPIIPRYSVANKQCWIIQYLSGLDAKLRSNGDNISALRFKFCNMYFYRSRKNCTEALLNCTLLVYPVIEMMQISPSSM